MLQCDCDSVAKVHGSDQWRRSGPGLCNDLLPDLLVYYVCDDRVGGGRGGELAERGPPTMIFNNFHVKSYDTDTKQYIPSTRRDRDMTGEGAGGVRGRRSNLKK